MPYAQIDTKALSSPKILALSSQSFRVWIAGLCYAQEHLTDGWIPRVALTALRVPIRVTYIKELVAANLWEQRELGWQIHDYCDWNRTRGEVEKLRAKWRRDKGRKARVSTVESTADSTVESIEIPPHRIRKDQDQELKIPPAAVSHLSVETVENSHRTTRRAVKGTNKKALTHVAVAVLTEQQASFADSDIKDATKARATALGLSYTPDSLRQALDAAEAIIGRQRGAWAS